MTSKRRPASNKRRSRFAIARALLFFFVFLGLDILFDNRNEIGKGSSCEAAHADESPWSYERIYPWLTSRLIEQTSTDRVRVVYIPEDLAEVQQNVCRGRAYLAALITLLQAGKPAAIVLDKYFSTDTCKFSEEEERESNSLVSAAQLARLARVPVIAGEATDTAGSDTFGSCLVQKPDYKFFPASAGVTYGLTKLNANREQLPLTWPVLDKPALDPKMGRPTQPPPDVKPQDALALASAKVVDPSHTKDPGFQAASHLPRHPYVQLDRPGEDGLSSAALLCRAGSAGCRAATQSSSSAPLYVPVSEVPSGFENKIIIIGSRNAVDRRLVLGKRRWGYELQAAYLDALLSDSYLKAVPGLWIFGLSILFLLVLEAVPALAEFLFCEEHVQVPRVVRKPEFWLWIWSLLFIPVVCIVCSVGHYLPPLSVLVTVFITMVTRGIFNGMEYFGKQSVPDRKETES